MRGGCAEGCVEGCAEGSELWWGGRRREAAEDLRCAEEIGGIGGCPVRRGVGKKKKHGGGMGSGGIGK